MLSVNYISQSRPFDNRIRFGVVVTRNFREWKKKCDNSFGEDNLQRVTSTMHVQDGNNRGGSSEYEGDDVRERRLNLLVARRFNV